MPRTAISITYSRPAARKTISCSLTRQLWDTARDTERKATAEYEQEA